MGEISREEIVTKYQPKNLIVWKISFQGSDPVVTEKKDTMLFTAQPRSG